MSESLLDHCIQAMERTFASLRHHRLRSGLIVLSISIGAASVATVGSISQLGKTAVYQEIASMGGDSLMVSADLENYPKTPLGEEELTLLRQEDAVEKAAPVTVFYAKASACGLEGMSTVWGVDGSAQDVVSLELVHGRFLQPEDLATDASVCVVDEKTAKAFYQRGNIVGQMMSLELETGQIQLEVVGVVRSGGSLMQTMMNDYIPFFIYLPYTSVFQWTGSNNFDHILLKTAENCDNDRLGREVTVCLANANQGPWEQYHADSLSKQREQLDRILEAVTAALSGIAAISLLVAGLGVMTVMLVTVQERTREVGIKKALGASRRIILEEFLLEAFTMSLMGSIVGIGGGLLLIAGVCHLLGYGFVMDGPLVLMCFLLTNIIGVLSGVYPAWLAAQLRPVDAIRFDR